MNIAATCLGDSFYNDEFDSHVIIFSNIHTEEIYEFQFCCGWSSCFEFVGLGCPLNALCTFLVQKNSAMAGAITGAALALTSEDSSHEQIVQCAITGAAISTAANLLTGIF